MKITDPDPTTLQQATQGQLAALDRLLLDIQPGVFNLALRMLGHRDDAADATQEILLKVVTHLGSFQGKAAFPTWVFQIARNHLLTAVTHSREAPTVSLEAMAERLQAGLDFAASAGPPGEGGALTPQDKLEARQLALACTQNMLMALDREQRLVYLLDTVFDLPSQQAAAVLGIEAPAYRQRLSRVKARLSRFMGETCGLVSSEAPCRCDKQLPATRKVGAVGSGTWIAIHRSELTEAERHFGAFTRLSDAAAVFRAHPQYQAPEALRGAILAVLGTEGFMNDRPAHGKH